MLILLQPVGKGDGEELDAVVIWAAVIACISITVMLVLACLKIIISRKLDNKAIIADGICTIVCVYMYVVLLVFKFAVSLGASGLC